MSAPLAFDPRQAVLDALLKAPRPRGLALDVLAARIAVPTSHLRSAIAFLDKHGCIRRGVDRLKVERRDHYLLTPRGRDFQKIGIGALDWEIRERRLNRPPAVHDYNSLYARTWRSIRVQRKFTTADLLRVLLDAESTDLVRWRRQQSEVGRYVRALLEHGYLTALPGSHSSARRLMLLDDTGVLPPVWVRKRDRVYDYNTRKWRARAQIKTPAAVALFA